MHKTQLLSLDEAIQKIRLNFTIKSNEDIFLQDANSRCLSKPIISIRDNPSFDVSSMDGYAINCDDYITLSLNSENNSEGFVNLKIIGESSAGNPCKNKIKSGETIRVFTGAKLPLNCDAVIIQENVTTDKYNNYITTKGSIKKYQNIREKGLDLKKGQSVFSKGTVLNSRHIGSIAMSGNAWVTVTRKPVISVLSSGNEILKVGEQLTENQMPSGNNIMLASMITEFGGIPRILPIADDNESNIFNIINNALDSDLIITSGGVSVGKYDLIQKALLKFKNKNFNEFWKIAMRPGKPLLFSRIDKTPILGLPGNPVSSGVCALIFLKIAINKMLGIETNFPIFEKVTLDGFLKKNDERIDFIRAKIKNIDGYLFATPFDKQDSSMIHQFSIADCLIYRDPFEKETENGNVVKIIRFPKNI